MSVLKSIYGNNGLFKSPFNGEDRMDLMCSIYRSPAELFGYVREKFGLSFANAFRSKFTNWDGDLDIEHLSPDPVTVIERTILEFQVGLTKSDVREHLYFFYGEKVVEEFDRISPMGDKGLNETGEYPPLLALMFAGHVLVSLQLQPVEPRNPLIILFVANESFDMRMKRSLV